jgi:peptidoglycan L-alanyl-D-glutamate endopeptidase CwlK
MMTPDGSSNRRIAALDPDMRPLANMAVNIMYARGQPVRVVHGNRSNEEQNSLYAIGRGADRGVHRTVTDARGGQSAHNCGCAVDVYPLENGGVVIPPTSDPRWQVIGQSGKSVGLGWGGEWVKRDMSHLELPGYRDKLSQQ